MGRQVGLYKRGIESAFHTSGARPAAADDTAWVHPTMWGEALLAGNKPKSKEEALSYFTSWVYICTKLNAQAVASVPMRLYVAKENAGGKVYYPTRSIDASRRKWLHSRAGLEPFLTKSREVEELLDHPFLDLMRTVNPYHNSRDMRELTTMYGDLAGEAYWLVVRDKKLGYPVEIWPIPAQFMSPIYGESLAEAIKGFLYKRGSTEIVIPYEDVVHFPNPNPYNVFSGFACVLGVADAVYVQSEMYATEAALFENRARPGGILTSAENVSKPDKERLREDFKQRFEGSKRAGRTLVLPKGMDYKRDVLTPDELNYIEGRREMAREIMASFNVPESMFMKEANRANAEQAEYHHAKHGVLPRCERIAQKINERLMPEFEGETTKVFVEFDDPVPQNRELLIQERQAYVRMGLPINRVLSEMGEDPVDGGDEPLVDGTLKPLSQVLEPPQIPPALAPPAPSPQPVGEPDAEEVEELALRTIAVIKERLDG